MMFYALVDHNDNGTVFHGVFETLYHANKAIANYYVDLARSEGEVNDKFKYKLSLYYAFEDEDEDLIDCLLSRYHDFIFNGLEDKTYSTDFEVILIELNEFLVDE